MINEIEAHIKFNHMYTCAKCNRQEVGDTGHISFRVFSTAALKQAVDGLQATSNSMPNEWSYNGEYTCKECRL